ncbi:MAG: hypothetical protein ABJJ69_12060 [Paracoccaceae bacterium]
MDFDVTVTVAMYAAPQKQFLQVRIYIFARQRHVAQGQIIGNFADLARVLMGCCISFMV